MDFSYNEIQAMLDDSVEKFIANDYDFETRQAHSGSDKGYSEDVWSTFAELGWTAVPFSEEDGGFDGGPLDVMVVMERFGRGLIVEPWLANVILAGGALRRVATPEQKERWLAPIIGGELQATLIERPQEVHTFPLHDGSPQRQRVVRLRMFVLISGRRINRTPGGFTVDKENRAAG